MSLATSYLITTKNLEALLNAIQTAQAPERFNNKFLEALDFKSSNDRLYIGVFKELGFVDDSGIPTQRYYDFLDQGQSKAVMASAIKEAYGDLFAVNKHAWKLSYEDVKNKLRTLTQGKKSDKVLSLMASTFRALCDYADWEITEQKESFPAPLEQKLPEAEPEQTNPSSFKNTSRPPVGVGDLHYNIQIHLPDSRDPAVFDAIFQSLRRHLF